jgi:hypothetical protein
MLHCHNEFGENPSRILVYNPPNQELGYVLLMYQALTPFGIGQVCVGRQVKEFGTQMQRSRRLHYHYVKGH